MDYLSFFFWFIENGSWVAGISILSERKLGWKLTGIMTISFIPMFFLRVLSPMTKTNGIGTIMSLLLFVIFILLVFYKTKKIVTSIFICSIPMILQMSFIFVANLLLWLLYDVNSIQESSQILIITIVEVCLSALASIGGCLIVKNLMKRYLINELLEGKYGPLFILFPMLGVIIFSMNFYFVKSTNFLGDSSIRGNIILFTIFSIVLLLVVFILFRVIFNNLKIENERKQNQQLSIYMKELEKQNDEIRKIRHDYLNIMTTMSGYLEQEDVKGLQVYFSDKIRPLGEKIEKNDAQLGRLTYIRIPEIKAILATKLLQAQKSEIRLIVDIVDPVENFHMDTLKLSRALGIILDNAIEAARESEIPQLDISFVEKKNEHFILVKNTYRETPPIHLIFKQGFSTKGENRGLGLSNLREIFSDCENVSLNTYVDDEKHFFFQEISINY
ncbi:sensor histidine kinase [Enterococcus mundtii]|uniref:Sensor histidine kinase NatK-like C-terminal domain-containing protein n=1 Tax=Enterococcus mundtii TaxID=53346 RepID=A0A2S7RZ28_ENTMU|nr:GHKL domain-containing protein [Enterococcus mundtii]PQF25462.1 hypothetical protein CUS89_01485 [Enterococcus mundtii]